MPIYEYECRACGHGFEHMQKISDPMLKDCPECAKPTLKKLISPVAFRLKGTGWYETDFKNKRSTEQTSTQSNENGKEASDTKSESGSTSKSSDDSSTLPTQSISNTTESSAE